MRALQEVLRRTSLVTVAFALLATLVAADVLIFANQASAAQITSRKLTLSSSANGNVTVGAASTGTNGAQTRHTFDFTEGTAAATIGSIEFLYCTTPLPGTTCTAPTGMDASTVTSIGGTTAAGWSLGTAGNAPTASRIRITRSASNITDIQNLYFGAGGTGTDYIKNPTTDNASFFVRMTTYSDTAWTTAVDNGTVANSTADQIDITAKVQETLNFSVGSTHTAPTASCVALTNANLPLGSSPDGVLDFTQAYDANSYFRISTNANNGTLIYFSGDTLKNGANSIASIGLAAAGTSSAPGTAQFGLGIDTSHANHSFTNLAANNGSNIAGHAFDYSNADGTITNGGTAKFQYDVNSVTVPKPIAIAAGTVTCDTGAIRYLGNISTTTPPGIYTTVISYLAVPTY